VVFTLAFALLGSAFEYPEILRKPAEEILPRFVAGGVGLIALWYTMLVAALAFIPLTVLLHQHLKNSPIAQMALPFGVLAGLVQALGFARWVFLVPHLASTFADTTSSQGTKEATVVIFSAFHQYLGVGVGEHLGYLLTGVWSILICFGLYQKQPVLAKVGLIFSVGILLGMLEPAGLAWAGTVNAIAYLGWSAWLVWLGVGVLFPVFRQIKPNLAQIGLWR
jgi:hypothetical protein